MGHADHPGTQGVYSAHWDGWVRWCVDHSVPPYNPSSCDFANFLAFLSCDKGLSAFSVKVHRSAVCTTIRQMGGPTFSDDSNLILTVAHTKTFPSSQPLLFFFFFFFFFVFMMLMKLGYLNRGSTRACAQRPSAFARAMLIFVRGRNSQ